MNGFEINISESDFKSKLKEDQAWILFQGIVTVNKSIVTIENEGCEFAKKKHKDNLKWILSTTSGTVVFVLGIVYIIYQMVCGK